MGSNPNDDEELMRRSFEQFMIGGGSAASNNASTPAQQSESNKNKSPLSTNKRKPSFHKLAQHVQTPIDAFLKIFVNEFLHEDDQLRLMVESIADLRERIFLISRKQKWDEISNARHTASGWASQGFRGRDGMDYLQANDLDMAMSHSLQSHERMLSSLRQGMSRIASIVETLGRRLDDVMEHFASFRGHSVVPGERDLFLQVLESVGNQVETCLEFYRAVAFEVYRKQCSVQSLVDSAQDGLFFSEDSTMDVTTGADETLQKEKSGKYVASIASLKWSRSNKESAFRNLAEKLEIVSTAVKEKAENRRFATWAMLSP